MKLLAVEFYATWCKPCMAAVPRWKELHEKYRRQGLRLVVVATQDPEGGCSNPGWNPDDVICDDEGQLARVMGANQLPAAFLWSWQGNLLVRKGHVDEVESEIRSWLDASPRVDVRVARVEEGSGVGETELRDLVRTELGRSDKLTVVASEAERARLDAVRKAAFSERFDASSRCDLGKELSPNSMLEVSVFGSSTRKRLRLGLLSVEKGCLITSALVDWNASRPTVSVAEAVTALVSELRPEVESPRGGVRLVSSRPANRERDIGETFEEWNPTGRDRALVRFSSNPPGAVVMLDGELLCQDTSRGCSRALPVGSHELSMQRERYQKRSERIQVVEGLEVDWTLEPSFATVRVDSDPPGLPLKVDGKEVGKTPLEALELMGGRHELLVSDPCYFDKGKRLTMSPVKKKDFRVE